MQMIWPSTMVPSLASMHRHVAGHKTHLLPPDQRGVFLTTTIDPEHAARSVQRRTVTAWARSGGTGTEALSARADTTFFTRADVEWPDATTVRISPAFFENLASRLRGHGDHETEFRVSVEPKDDPEALQVLRIHRHDDVPLAEFAVRGFVTTARDTVPVLPRDPRDLSEFTPLAYSRALETEGPGPERLRRFTYRRASFATAVDAQEHPLLLARWSRNSTTTLAAAPMLYT